MPWSSSLIVHAGLSLGVQGRAAKNEKAKPVIANKEPGAVS